ncbi:hypothetical protein IC229_29700 [Spirosoma sp. BT702]|uniref:Uncharacterized protein n=1 Tax=Spirosoma profusum TaxID=2771354 RepID=A0A927G9U1_9BACT|nr:hypothetical protein [Spirosoma profusum]
MPAYIRPESTANSYQIGKTLVDFTQLTGRQVRSYLRPVSSSPGADYEVGVFK